MVFGEAIKSYKKNLSASTGFALLLVFVLPFVWLSNSFVSSGSIFIDYGFVNQPLIDSALLLVFALAFLFFYSLLVCLMVFSVRKDLSQVKVQLFLNEKIVGLALRYFRFLAIFTVIGAIIASLLMNYGFSVEIINVILMLVSVSFMFLGQTIVIDEESLGSSVLSNWEFILKNPVDFLFVSAVGVAGVLLLELVEFVLDYFFLIGSFVSLLVALVVLVPFLETLKTRIYMKRFDIIRNYHARD